MVIPSWVWYALDIDDPQTVNEAHDMLVEQEGYDRASRMWNQVRGYLDYLAEHEDEAQAS